MACQAMAPVVHGLEKQYGDKIQFIYLDVDDPANQALAQTLGRRGQPEFYLLDGSGQVIERWAGPVREATFKEAFDRLIASELALGR